MADGFVVVAPLRVEARALRAGLPALTATVVRGGMGPRAARACGARLAADSSDVPIVVAGMGGALSPELRPGQIVVATSVTDGARRVELPSGPLLAAQLRRNGHDAVAGPIVSTGSVVRGAERDALAERTGAIAVDMESAWLLTALGRHDHRGLAVVRVVVDSPAHELRSPGVVGRGVRGLRALRRLGPSLDAWAAALGPRRVLLAGPRSFCAGVERAIDIVQRALDRFGAPVYVRRQIVHNTHVVATLAQAGAVFVDELHEVPAGSTVVIAAHGVAPDVYGEAAARELRVVDATCPLVAKVHTEARRYARDGFHIVLVGHADHEEVLGTAGEAPDRIVVIDDPDDVAGLDVADPTKVAYLTQTTLAVDETANVVAALTARFPNAVGPRASDICYATQNRQEALRAVAAECNLVLVVGSPNSSNSNRLVEVASRVGCPARLVESGDEIDLRWLAGARAIGISAGASAPEHLVAHVVSALGALGPLEIEDREVLVEDVRFTLPAEVR
jgi:4-hydroxy-3-methylbut-2-en-1-yl diphosphate reductase